MKASELIEELRKAIETYGDWPVMTDTRSCMVVDDETGEIIARDPESVARIRAITVNAGQAKRLVVE